MTSSSDVAYLARLASGRVSENTQAMKSPGTFPKASTSPSTSRLRCHRLMKPNSRFSSSSSAWKSTGVIVRIRFFTRRGSSAA